MSEARNGCAAEAKQIANQLVAWRRHLHAHPELSGAEEQTAAFVANELRKMGYEPQERIGGTRGLTAMLAAGKGEAIALRADMDALPILEETGLEFASRNPGVMHACGHDAHMAMMLGAAQLLAQHRGELRHPVKFIFQAHEELQPGGAAPLIDAGVLAGVRCILGLHIWSELPTGTVGTRVGPFMSAVSDFRVVIEGAGGHAAMPHQCVDPVLVGAALVMGLQSVVSRSIAMTDEGVLSVTQFHGGQADNVIPARVELRGTIRTLSDAVCATMQQRVREIVAGTAAAHKAAASVDFRA